MGFLFEIPFLSCVRLNPFAILSFSSPLPIYALFSENKKEDFKGEKESGDGRSPFERSRRDPNPRSSSLAKERQQQEEQRHHQLFLCFLPMWCEDRRCS